MRLLRRKRRLYLGANEQTIKNPPIARWIFSCGLSGSFYAESLVDGVGEDFVGLGGWVQAVREAVWIGITLIVEEGVVHIAIVHALGCVCIVAEHTVEDADLLPPLVVRERLIDGQRADFDVWQSFKQSVDGGLQVVEHVGTHAREVVYADAEDDFGRIVLYNFVNVVDPIACDRTADADVEDVVEFVKILCAVGPKVKVGMSCQDDVVRDKLAFLREFKIRKRRIFQTGFESDFGAFEAVFVRVGQIELPVVEAHYL